MSSAIVVYKYQQFVTRSRFMMNTKCEIQCAVRECTSKRGWNKNVSIYQFPKRRWRCWTTLNRIMRKSLLVEVRTSPGIRKTVFCLSTTFWWTMLLSEEEWRFSFKVRCCSDDKFVKFKKSCQSDVNMKPAAVSSPSEFEISMLEIEKPGVGIWDFGESSVQFAHVSSYIFNFIRCC